MITLSVLQQGNIVYTTANSQDFNPAYIAKLKQVTAQGDSTCTQFNYCGIIYIVSDSITAVRAAITTANTIALAGIAEDNVTQLVVGFNLTNVQSVVDIDGYAGVTYAYTPDAVGFRATSLAVSTTSTDFAGLESVLGTAGFVRVAVEQADDTTRDSYLNLSAIQGSSVYAADAPTTYTLPNGTQLVGYSLYTYTVDFTGILAGDTLDTIDTGLGTITVNLGCVTAPNRTAIAAAITAYLLAAGAQYGTVAVTQPSSGKMRIVIPDTNVVFVDATCTLSATPTTEDFVIT